ncbi:MAG: sugar kinase [Bifidobacteriaceae bacterium]|jgi:2-dehydro-3-deoxygluconokinase|nr:sugar kinase [Bifidobacteriaceae bacterium]
MSGQVVTFGEIMLRLNPPGYTRLVQTETFEASYSGGEANVAVCLASLGLEAAYVSVVPPGPVGQAAVNAVRRYGVDTRWMLRQGDRLGLYFVERGASQRPSQVVYDRARSAIAQAEPSAYDWPAILDGASWLHTTGITPALGERPAAACLEAVQTAKRLGLTVSCDLNYRSKLWSRHQAGATMGRLMEHVDLCIANEQDAQDVFGISAPDSDIDGGKLSRAGYVAVARELAGRFGLERVAITLRGSLSASHNTWSGLLYQDGEAFFTPTYDLTIVDRVGGGDSFGAGLIYALQTGLGGQAAIDFAVAASALKHSIEHDFALITASEVAALAAGNASGRVVR